MAVGQRILKPMKVLSSCFGSKEAELLNYNLLSKGQQFDKDLFAFEAATVTDKAINGWIQLVLTK